MLSFVPLFQKMESMLLSFKTDLGSISSEILYLQRKSVAMSQQLSNRQVIRGPLSQFIEDMTVSEALIMYDEFGECHVSRGRNS